MALGGVSRNPSPRVPGPRGGPCEGSPCRQPRRPHPPSEGRWAPCGGAARRQGTELGRHGGPRPGRHRGTPPRASQGDPAWRRHSPGSCRTWSCPPAAAFGEGVDLQGTSACAGLRCPISAGRGVSRGGSCWVFGERHWRQHSVCPCPRWESGTCGLTSEAPEPASVHPADASVLRGDRGPSRPRPSQPSSSWPPPHSTCHRLTPIGLASATLPTSASQTGPRGPQKTPCGQVAWGHQNHPVRPECQPHVTIQRKYFHIKTKYFGVC